MESSKQRARWHRTVVDAYHREGTLRAAGATLGISHARVLQILREEKEHVHPRGSNSPQHAKRVVATAKRRLEEAEATYRAALASRRR